MPPCFCCSCDRGHPQPAAPDGTPIENPKERVDCLVKQLDKSKTKIVIPTPALSEALVRAGAAASQSIIEHLQRYPVFRIEPFDTRAGIEVAAMTRDAIDSGRKKGNSAATWAKVKYDRQIIAIANADTWPVLSIIGQERGAGRCEHALAILPSDSARAAFEKSPDPLNILQAIWRALQKDDRLSKGTSTRWRDW